MEVLFLMIGASLSLAFFFLLAFIWAVKSGQFEDTYGPSIKILFDEDREISTQEKKGE